MILEWWSEGALSMPVRWRGKGPGEVVWDAFASLEAAQAISVVGGFLVDQFVQSAADSGRQLPPWSFSLERGPNFLMLKEPKWAKPSRRKDRPYIFGPPARRCRIFIHSLVQKGAIEYGMAIAQLADIRCVVALISPLFWLPTGGFRNPEM